MERLGLNQLVMCVSGLKGINHWNGGLKAVRYVCQWEGR